MVSTLTRQISLATWPSSCTQMIVTVKGIAPYLPTILHGIKRCAIDHRRSHRKRKQLVWPCWLRCCPNQRYSPINGHPWIDPSLTDRGIELDEAISIVRSMTAYTNHTILAEALENGLLNSCKKWFLTWYQSSKNWTVAWKQNTKIQLFKLSMRKDRVHMAHMDIHYGYSVNGVAALHTEILKNSELKAFYDIYPEKFNNKTNGITFRRWLMHANPNLVSLLGWYPRTWLAPWSIWAWKTFLSYEDKAAVKEKLENIKAHNKRKLARYLKEHPRVWKSIQTLSLISKSNVSTSTNVNKWTLCTWSTNTLDIKAGNIPARPITVLFGGKAAPAYTIAQDIIHLILCMSEVIANDPAVAPHLQVVMVENYNVTAASFLDSSLWYLWANLPCF